VFGWAGSEGVLIVILVDFGRIGVFCGQNHLPQLAFLDEF
jgi:hypothetical protein